MSLKEEIRQQARLDSRRFAKSTVCRIVNKELLDYLVLKNIVPTGLLLNRDTGMCPRSNKIMVIPVTKYAELYNMFINLNKENSVKEEDIDVEYYDKLIRGSNAFLTAIKQNIIFVTMEEVVPEGIRAGANPEVFDVLIDTLDVNQTLSGTYVLRNTKSTLPFKRSYNSLEEPK